MPSRSLAFRVVRESPVRVLCTSLALIAGGCAVQSEPGVVSEALAQRTGYELAATEAVGGFELPPSVSLEDGLSEVEAVELALRNNAEFRAELSGLDVAEAAVLEARLLPNPEIALLLPVGPKQLEQTLNWSFDALLQRPWRVAAAQRDLAQVQERLVQRGLQAVHDARLAHSEAVLAQERARLAYEAAFTHTELAEIAQVRLRGGDISELEASAALIESMRVRDDASQLENEAARALGLLRLQLGMEVAPPERLELVSGPVAHGPAPELAALLDDSSLVRPDVRAAEHQLQAAAERIGLERSRVLSLAGIMDGNERGEDGGQEWGPGARFGIPIFNWNQGARARAKAEAIQAQHRYVAVRQRAANEVREARDAYERARTAELQWRTAIGPAAEAALEGTRLAYDGGQESYRVVLEVTRQLIETRTRGVEVAAELRRASARLDLSVGRRVFDGH